ncbi:hypothetical protein DFJ63DRAFT_317277 [Scheffersomyces coipomensis]|uniref:uncharacterized protein n=1 Tax=Scheffersomyces coipomensis TaxID=1788519 RepID=UPI00315C56B7
MLRLHRCLARDTTRRLGLTTSFISKSSIILYHNNVIPNKALVRHFHERITLNEPRTSLHGYMNQNKRSKLNPKIILHDYSSVEQLVNSDSLREKYLIALRDSSFYTDKEIDIIEGIFNHAIDLAFGFKDPTTINLVLEIWRIAFDKRNDHPSLIQLQIRLLKQKNDLVYMLINSKNYAFYDLFIRPLYNNSKFIGLEKSWEDTLISTFELGNDGKIVRLNRNKVKNYLSDNSVDIQTRRRLLANLIKTLIINTESYDGKYTYISHFFEFLQVLGDDHFRFIGKEYNSYHKVLSLIAIPFEGFGFLKHVSNITTIFENQHIPPKHQADLITSFMRSIAFSPNNVLNYWKFKLDTYYSEDEMNGLNYKDLKYAMMALLELNEYQKVVDLYEEFSEFHDDDHIEILLSLSDRMKDWKSMQRRFEDMYGKGNLPFVVHYAIVMNALASTGASSEVEQLFQQLKDRQLIPDRNVFAALIKSKVTDNDFDGALAYFNSFCELVKTGKLEVEGKSALFMLVFESYVNSNDLDGALVFLDKALKDPEIQALNVIDAAIIAKLIDLAAGQFRLNEVVKLKKLSETLDLSHDDLSLSVARAYAKFGQFDLADKAVYEAHKNSRIPFTNAKVYDFQLKLYRIWYNQLTHSNKRTNCKLRTKFIIKFASNSKSKIISPRKNETLYKEIINFYIQEKDMAGAYDTLEKVKKKSLLAEDHYLPFLKYYSSFENFKAHSSVLKLYKEMVSYRIDLSAKTYVFLMRTMLFLDKQNQKGYGHSLRLLTSVFEMNGLSLKVVHPIAKVEYPKLRSNSTQLCIVVSDYVHATQNRGNADMLFQFFQQMKEVLGTGMTIDFKMTVCNEMSKIYFQTGEIDMAIKLIDSGIADLEQVISKLKANYPSDMKFSIPRQLENQYRHLVIMKMKNLQDKDLVGILKRSSELGIKLGGNQYNDIITTLLERSVSVEDMDLALKVSEDHLVSGNKVNVFIALTLRRWYRTIIYILSANTPAEELMSKYEILNQFYGVSSISELKKEFGNDIERVSNELDMDMKKKSKLVLHSKWRLRKVLQNIPVVFSPGRQIDSENKISHTNASLFIRRLKRWPISESSTALKAKYPKSFDFLHNNHTSLVAYNRFRERIDQIIPPQRDEATHERLHRWTQALRELKL